MAHKLLLEESLPVPSFKEKLAKWVPDVEGKFGVALYLGGKEIFLGLTIGTVEIEHIIKKRLVKIPKAATRVFRFDPLA